MQKSADTLASATDPLRVAMSQALFHSSVPPDNMAAAKMRLKLYAGLNEAALEALFTPKTGAISSCVRTIGATQAECEALVAAAGRTSVAEARSAAGGAAPLAVAVAAPVRASQPAPAGGSRFGHYDSGFRGGAAPMAQPQPQPAFAAAPVRQQPAFAARQAPVAQTAGMSQKEAYKAQREAYLARKKAEFEERKQKMADASAPPPGTEANVSQPKAAVASAKAEPAPAPTKGAPAKGAVAAAAEEPAAAEPAEVAKKSDKPALDNDFLDGLLSDPLGGKK
jgi:hypothetical protein